MKIHEGKNGRYVTFEKGRTLYIVALKDSSGNLVDKVKCDDFRSAVDYRKAFIKQARA